MAAAQNFRDLIVWQEAYELTIMVYNLCKKFPDDERFGLTSQLKRAIISVTSNIAEGFGRIGAREKDNFYSIASGSLTETENQIIIARGVNYISESDYLTVEAQIVKVHKLLYGLRKVNKEKGVRK